MIRPFADYRDYWLSDLYKYNFVFLQHGIIKDDLSGWLRRPAKDIDIFVTSTRDEYESIVNGNYLYGEQIKQLGLPRYDRLIDKSRNKRRIIIIPTWRKSLAGPYNATTGEREYNKYFDRTEYFDFYNRLLNDERLLSVMRAYKYKMTLALHPCHIANASDFTKNDRLKILTKEVDYNSLFCNSSLLVTDYSSVAFDFAYLNKPIIYTQFDVDSFFEQHTYDKGYFEYERDGFGPVFYDYEATVAAIIKTIKNGCKQPEKYAKRIEKTFAFHDTNNCKRIYEEIIKLGNR